MNALKQLHIMMAKLFFKPKEDYNAQNWSLTVFVQLEYILLTEMSLKIMTLLKKTVQQSMLIRRQELLKLKCWRKHHTNPRIKELTTTMDDLFASPSTLPTYLSLKAHHTPRLNKTIK